MVAEAFMKQKALPDALAGWYTSICPVCGKTIYTRRRSDGKHTSYDPFKLAFMPTDRGEELQNDDKDVAADTTDNDTSPTQQVDEYDVVDENITVLVCPRCKSRSWAFDRELVNCACGKPAPVTETFIM